MDWIGFAILGLLITQASPASVSTPTTQRTEQQKTSPSYQVTENIDDIPDDRSLPPILRNFTLVTPLNYGNNSIAIANNNAAIANNNAAIANNNAAIANNNAAFANNNAEAITNNNVETELTTEITGEGSSSEEGDDKKVKKNSFSILHIKAEYDDKPVKSHGLKKILGGIKDYVYSIKKGVVDGLHSYFHAGDVHKTPVKDFHSFHRDFGEDFGHYDAEYFDHDDSKEHSFGDY